MTMTMPQERVVRIDRIEKIAVRTFDNLTANAPSQSLRQALVGALKAVTGDGDIDVVVVDGYGFPREPGGSMSWDTHLRNRAHVS
jgi:enoyl-CoA hydratase/carnithine racemase